MRTTTKMIMTRNRGENRSPRRRGRIDSTLIALAAVLLAVLSGPARANDPEPVPLSAHGNVVGVTLGVSGAIALDSGAEMHTRDVTSAGAITQNASSKVFMKGNLDVASGGSWTSADTATTEFNGSRRQTIAAIPTLDFGRLRVNNTATAPLEYVHLCADCSVFKLEIDDGHLDVMNDRTEVFSTDAGADPMVHIEPGTQLTLNGPARMMLSGGKFLVASGATLTLAGTTGGPALLDQRSGATGRYALEIAGGEVWASGFSVLRSDANGVDFKAGSLVSRFDNGTFDRAAANATYIRLSDANPIRFDVSQADLLKFIRFDDTDLAGATVKNVTASTGTALKDASGSSLARIVFKEWLGTKGGEAHDSEPGSENKIRWWVAPNAPTALGQFKQNGATSISTGGTTDENAVVLKGTVSQSESNAVSLEVEIEPTAFVFDGVGTQVSGQVASGSQATAAWPGLANGNYHWRARAVDELGAVSGWVSFAGNPETSADFVVSVTNDPPDTPSAANQYMSDGTTPISAGGTTTETTVVFKATVTDPNSDTVKLQVELKAFGAPFDAQTGLYESSPVSSGSTATATASSLANGTYHWRYRAIDSKGHASSWSNFQPDSTFDLQVATQVTPPSISTSTHKTKDTTPQVAGTSPASASIEVFADGVSVGTTTASGGGAWSLSTGALAEGPHAVTAKATVGPNTSLASLPIVLTIDTIAPQAPEWVSCTPLDGAILVEWAPSSSPDVWGYHVYRKLDTEGEGSWTKLTTDPVSAASPRFLDTGLSNGTRYNYRVTAVDDAEDQ